MAVVEVEDPGKVSRVVKLETEDGVKKWRT